MRALRWIVGSPWQNISAIRRAKAGHFGALPNACLSKVSPVNPAYFSREWSLAALLIAGALPLQAQTDEAALASQVQQFAAEATRRAAEPGLRAQVSVGRLDPRLRLAPCASVQPYLPTGTRLWGAARIGLRCTDAQVRWNVFLPIQIDVFGPAWVARAPLPAGHVLGADDLRLTEVNLAAAAATPLGTEALIGRALARPMASGDAVRDSDLRARQWFAAGDSVRLVATGAGWRIHGEGQALTAGLEGRAVRVRTESGRVVSGVAVAERLVEVAL